MSRARRIVLAMYGHREFTPFAQVMHPHGCPTMNGVAVRDVYGPGWHGCYEAMDEPDDDSGAWIIPPAPRYYDTHCYCCDGPPPCDVDPITADLPLSPIVGGNYGLPCA